MNIFWVFGRDGRGVLKEIISKLDQIIEEQKKQRKFMNSFKDVQDGIAKLGQDMKDEIAAINAKLTPPPGETVVAQADIDSAKTALDNLSTTIEAETAALSTASVTAPVPDSPAPDAPAPNTAG